MAADFVEKTGVDVLAPAIGSVHGLAVQKDVLNLEMLRHIKEITGCSLSLHGGSGVSDINVWEAIDIGLNKASVYTRISKVAIQKIKDLTTKDSPDLAVIVNEIRNGYREMIENSLRSFRSVNICLFQPNVCKFVFDLPYINKNVFSDAVNQHSQELPGNFSQNYEAIVEIISREVINNFKKDNY